ncbi:NUDIX hydrolase [Ovoidimarina sediminis]|uniref:NUDIX hydrolase n=1 Tax=Ovoidimarina sediminis TaxID=3079856 RepID=UPI002907F346|nr:NUDIX hydrolase [Rhodophyticola sp. MJ-SS7]MDU8942131.1 NUDIX hydrolase [Rhodophyticola sp. MJ-SS7]
MTDTPIRDAATVIVLRNATTSPAVLMGQRGAGAAFMPNKVVFPGGAVDANDAHVSLAQPLPTNCANRISQNCIGPGANALATAAIRELWEETGLILGRRASWPDAPSEWAAFAATGHRPDAGTLSFVFRAITPPGRPRRFDARFFLVDANHISGDPDDFSRASDELTHLQWIPIDAVRRYDLPFITEIVLAEVAARLPDLGPPALVPFFQNDDEDSRLRVLGRV